MDIANLLIGIAGILIGLLTALWGMRHARKLAEESGAFRKPEIGVAIFNCPIGDGYPDNENWIFIHPGGSDDYVAYPIKFTVFNHGNISTQDILISINVPNRIFWKSQLNGMDFSTYPSLKGENIKQSVDELGNFTLISFLIPPLSPSSSFELVLPFSFTPTFESVSFPIEVAKKMLYPNISVLFQNIISITIHSGDLTPKFYELRMGAIPALNLVDGVQKLRMMKNQQIKEKPIDKILNIFKYVETIVTNCVSFEIEKTVQIKGFKAFIMALPNQYHRMGWLNVPSNDINKLKNLEHGDIVGVIDLKTIFHSQRKFRYKEGNLIL